MLTLQAIHRRPFARGKPIMIPPPPGPGEQSVEKCLLPVGADPRAPDRSNFRKKSKRRLSRINSAVRRRLVRYPGESVSIGAPAGIFIKSMKTSFLHRVG
jgi:hypothetical protein